MKRLCIGWILLATMPLAQAELERWTDDNGVIYYRNLESHPAETISPPPKASRKSPASSRKSASAIAQRERKAALKRRRDQEKAEARQEKQCARLHKKLDGIQQKLDDGYREPRGNTLRRQRRELQSQIFRECR